MKKMSEPIVFFGSGPVAAESLRLLAQNFTIEAVITKPRAAHHRGDVPVLALAEELKLPVHTVTNRKTLDELFATEPVQSRLAILIDFGIIVSQKVIDYFSLGIINSHFSLLPEWRGADPITFSVLSGQKQTGVSLMMLVEAMDEGPLLAQGVFTMPADITTPELTHELILISDALLADIVPQYIEGTINPVNQEIAAAHRTVSYSRKLTKDDSIADWNKPAAQLEREIRAFTGWPKTRTSIKRLDVIIIAAHVVDVQGEPGTFAIIDKRPVAYCSEQALVLDMVKPAGKKEMTGEAFLAGYKHLFS